MKVAEYVTGEHPPHHTPPVGPMSSFLPPTPTLEQDGAREAKKGDAGSTDFLGFNVIRTETYKERRT